MKREAQDVRARLLALPTSAISDALGKRGVVGTRLARISGGGPVCGPARTAQCFPGSLAAIGAAIRASEPGEVICCAAPGTGAYMGGLIAMEAGRRGLAGLVIDGYVRDFRGLRESGMTVYARGVTPAAVPSAAPGHTDVPVALGDTVLFPGDWIVGDDDGVVAVPQQEVGNCLESAAEIVAREAQLMQAMLEGESLYDALSKS